MPGEIKEKTPVADATEAETSNRKPDGEGIPEVAQNATVTKYGSFKDANALLEGYNALRSEFTRRCQRVKQLEGENVKLKEQISNNEKSLICERGNPEKPSQKGFSAKEGTSDGTAVSFGETLADGFFESKDNYADGDVPEPPKVNPYDEEKIVKEFLIDVHRAQKVTALMSASVGGVALTPPDRPQNFIQAGKMAEKMLRKKG